MTDSILIVGGGVTGLTAALACAEAGARITLVERGPIIGGRLAAAMTDDSSFGSTVDGVPNPRIATLAKTANIEILTLADLARIDGRPGNFDVTIRERARLVTDACTRCNNCRPVCPSVQPNEYDEGLSYRKAIYTPLPQTLPQEFVIDIDSCLNSPPNYLPCNRCIEVCDDNAIHFDMLLERSHDRKVGAVILATGLSISIDGRLSDYGYGSHPDIVTSTELQRLLTAPGPTGGYAARPSDEEYPERVLLILDELTPGSAYTAVSQIHRLVEQRIGKITLLVTTQPREDHELDSLPSSVEVAWGLVQKIEPEKGGAITVSYADFSSSRVPADAYDMVVLSADVAPAHALSELASVVGCDLDPAGYIATPDVERPCATSRAGVYAAGGTIAPVTLPDAVGQARTAAAAALADLDPRLLRPGYAQPAREAAGAVVRSDEDLRARIERALEQLIRRAD